MGADALVDLTGGVGAVHTIARLDSGEREAMFWNLHRNFHWNTLIGAGVNVS